MATHTFYIDDDLWKRFKNIIPFKMRIDDVLIEIIKGKVKVEEEKFNTER